MEPNLATAGLFRANPNASNFNALRLVDPNTPGTAAQDQGTVDTTAGTPLEFTGIEYTGKDGQTITLQFEKEQIPDGQKISYKVPVANVKDLEDAIRYAIEKHEVGPIVNVANASGTYTITHIGSGTLSKVFLDGTANNLARTTL